jgi:hypothetical protein
VRVHDLVQRATRDQLDEDELEQVVRVAADALAGAWPDLENDSAQSQLLMANATAVSLYAEHLWTWRGGHPVLFQTGRSLNQLGSICEVTVHWQRVHDAAHARLGPHHRDTMIARAELAVLAGEAGNPHEAAELLEVLLDEYRQLISQTQSDSPDYDDLVHNMLMARYDLIRWRAAVDLEYGDEDGVEDAVAQFADLLKDFADVFGANHAETLTLRHNLAHWRGLAGDRAGAIDDYEKLLAERCRVLGPNHPSTLATRHNLAGERGEAGDLDGMVAEYQRLVEDFTRLLGPDHPNTLTARYNLAHSRGEAGDTVGAGTALAELRDHSTRVLDPNHPLHLVIAFSPFLRRQGTPSQDQHRSD